VSEELSIHIKALAVRLHIEQAQMRSYSELVFCISDAFAVSDTEQAAILGCFVGRFTIYI